MVVTEKNGVQVIELAGRINMDNAAEVEKEIMDIFAANKEKKIVFDAGRLEYISSAGLRVLMKVRKKQGSPVRVENVSRDVYEIFDTTGFTELLDVKKALREISVDGCELIGSGGYGKVYRIDPETIAKIYREGCSLEFVDRERENSQKAFVFGVPTAISYDVVKCGNSYGVIYELLDAKTMAEIAAEDRSRVAEMGARSGKLLRTIHETKIEKNSGFPSEKAMMMEWAEVLDRYMDAADAEKIRKFVEAIPDDHSFLHGDFHSKNIMLKGDEIQIIDIGDAAYGHPVYDVAEVMLAYIIMPKLPVPSAEERRRFLGFELEDAPTMWGAFCGAYFGIQDKEEIGKLTQKLMPYGQLMLANQSIRHGGLDDEAGMRSRTERLLKPMLLPAIGGAEPVESFWR